jgi:hypothetical protein
LPTGNTTALVPGKVRVELPELVWNSVTSVTDPDVRLLAIGVYTGPAKPIVVACRLLIAALACMKFSWIAEKLFLNPWLSLS